MKKILWGVGMMMLSVNTWADVSANDSAVLGENHAQMVFYQYGSGNKTAVDMSAWQLAVTVRATQFPDAPLGGTTIRINEAFGTRVFKTNELASTLTSNMDTTGWHSWPKLHDSDTVLDEGSLNSERTANIFDFGWGFYNQNSHNVVGDSLFLIELPNGAVKKLLVTTLIRDTAFDIQTASVDGSDVQTLHITKANYVGKNFVYLNLLDGEVSDLEPPSSEWDLLFLNYTALDVSAGAAISQVGVLQNPAARSTRVDHCDVVSVNSSGQAFEKRLNKIGWDWKKPVSYNSEFWKSDANPIYYNVLDSLAFFSQAQNGHTYKLVFTGYTGSYTGIIRFYQEDMGVTALQNESASVSLSLYPNPTRDVLHVQMEEPRSYIMDVCDMSGRKVYTQNGNENQTTINVSGFASGMYMLTLTQGSEVARKRFIVE